MVGSPLCSLPAVICTILMRHCRKKNVVVVNLAYEPCWWMVDSHAHIDLFTCPVHNSPSGRCRIVCQTPR